MIDATPCEHACYEAHTRCVDACSEGENDPIDCEDRCDDARDDCLRQCG